MPGDTLKIGNVEITTVTDAVCSPPFTLAQLFAGTTDEQWSPYRERYPQGFDGPDRWSVHFGGHLVRAGGRTILVDTGMGPDTVQLFASPPGVLLESLKAQGVAAADVDVVFLTHAHIDHIGWNLTAEGTPTFPNARYVMHRADWEARHALQDVILAFGGEAYLDRTLTALEPLSRLDLLEGETALTSEVVALHTPGHTPGSMSVLIASGGEKAMITGDVMVTPAQVTEPDWEFGFDTDHAQAAATRKTLLDRVEADGITLATCHFPHPGYGHVFRAEGKRYWRAI